MLMSKEKKNKKKKVKTVYIDDGSTIADMSGIDSVRPRAFGSRPDSQKNNPTNKSSNGNYTGNKFKDSLHTYFTTVKLMIGPMLITIGIISAAFFIVWLLLMLAS